ncbi:hypothetical protein BGX27_001870, partial [Mortierella sp. AM989]
MFQMQLQIRQLQQKLEETQQDMIQMQKQTLGHQDDIKNRVQAVLTQTYELHEYSIPRLFIILPKRKSGIDVFNRMFSDQFKLFFLCECGKHTMTEESTIPHEIHIANHEGYDISRPTEFFEKYGPHILSVMQGFEIWLRAASTIMPALRTIPTSEDLDSQRNIDISKETMEALVDKTISFLEEQQQNGSTDGTDATVPNALSDLETLGIRELRQLQSFISINDSSHVLGNLYRTVTSEGHVKWVCFDHYRGNYHEKEIQVLRRITESYNGSFVKEIGKIRVELPSRTKAKRFYNAMTKARGVQELDIRLNWDVTMDDLSRFANYVTMANIGHLKVGGEGWAGPALDFANRLRRYDPVFQLGNNGRIQSLEFDLEWDVFKRMSNPSNIIGPQLRILKIGGCIKDDSGYKFLAVILGACHNVTELHLLAYRLRAIAEFIMDTLLPLQTVKCTDLEYISSFRVKKTSLALNFQRNIEMTSVSRNGAQAVRSNTFRENRRSGLTIHVTLHTYDYDFRGDLLSLYTNRAWSIKDLSVRLLDNDGSESSNRELELLDKLTERSAPKNLSLSMINARRLTIDGMQCLERVVERPQGVGTLCIEFDEVSEEKLRFLQGPIGRRVTDLRLAGSHMGSWMSELTEEILEGSGSCVRLTMPEHSRAYGTRLSFPMLESLVCYNRGDYSADTIRFITALVTKPSLAHEDSLPSDSLSPDDSTVIPPESTTNSLDEYRPLKIIRLNASLLSEDWTILIKALDFSTLEKAKFTGDNFLLTQFAILVECILDKAANGSMIALKSLDLSGTKLDECDGNDVEMQIASLNEVVPSIDIIWLKEVMPSQTLHIRMPISPGEHLLAYFCNDSLKKDKVLSKVVANVNERQPQDERPKPQVLIVGAGIGGLTLSILLDQINVPYHIFERASEVKPLGSGMAFAGNTLPALEQLGIYEEIKQISKAYNEARFYDSNIKKIGSTDMTPNIEATGYESLFLPRPKFYEILRKRIPDHQISFKKKVLRTEEEEGKVIIHCSDNTSYVGDILVGADGAYSGVRQNMYKKMDEKGLLPKSDLENFAIGYTTIVGVASPPNLDKYPQLKEENTVFHQVLYKGSANCYIVPLPDNQISWGFGLQLPKSILNDMQFRSSEWGPETNDATLERYRDLPCPLGGTMGDIFDSTPKNLTSKIFLEEKLFKTWHYGKTVLLGDGARNAICDAIVLANCIYAMPDSSSKSIEASFKEYYRQSYQHAEVAYDLSVMWSKILNGQ